MSSQIMQEINKSAVGAANFDGKYACKTFIFDISFIGFQGHFPGNPVLPAVVQFNMALDVLQDALDPGLQIASISKAKFSSILKPNTSIRVACRIDEYQNDQLVAFCQLYSADEQASSFKLNLSRHNI